ncbi:MAG TPA: hypothetical protein VFM80_06030 [Gracilimonas sp.]|uniref:TlpA family protein disulfide reductase n=1 Tax=Gracilimonas sp. TaxID=1974203 RepID=UPI002D88D432|nr:hypothetical protein [Gracilimonas sp.]
MKLILKLNRPFILVWMICFSGCGKDTYAPYYEKTANEWEQYISEISDKEEVSLSNTVLLVLTSSECTPSIAELKNWDTFNKESDSVNVQMVILEKYITTIQVFLDYENIDLHVYRDSAYTLIKKDLLPTTPMKVYFGKEGRVKKLSPIGTNNDPVKFINGL